MTVTLMQAFFGLAGIALAVMLYCLGRFREATAGAKRLRITPMSNTKVHIFVGRFPDIETAELYTQEQWEPEPDESVSDEVYQAWEDGNPKWQMSADLDAYLDSDFIETLPSEGVIEYLKTMISGDAVDSKIAEKIESPDDVVVLIFQQALYESSEKLGSTPRLQYLGEFPCTL